MSNKYDFRIMRQGYDRFEVDQVVQDLSHDKMMLEKQVNMYKRQMASLEEQRDSVKKRYSQLLSEVAVRERAAEEMSRFALREANTIIDKARGNADMIIREAMSTSRQVLVEIARISNESSTLRNELKDKIKHLEEVIDGLELPNTPHTKLLGDDQDTTDM